MMAFPGTGRPKDWAGTKIVNSKARFNCALTSSSSRPEIMRKFSTRPLVSTYVSMITGHVRFNDYRGIQAQLVLRVLRDLQPRGRVKS